MAINELDTQPSFDKEEPILPEGVLRLQILDCILNNIPVKKPYFLITLGDQKKQSTISEERIWKNEQFDLKVDFHAQLFGTLQLDLYESNTWFSDKHIGRTEIRLCLLETMPYQFTNYYEIWDKQLSSGASSSVGQETARKNNLGVLHIQIAYRYQLASSNLSSTDVLLMNGKQQDNLPRRLSDLLLSTTNNDQMKDDDDVRTDIYSITQDGPPGSMNLLEKEAMDEDLKRYAKFQRQRGKRSDGNNEYGSILNDYDEDEDDDDDDDDDIIKQTTNEKPLPAHETDTVVENQDSSKDNRQVLGAIGKLLAQFGQGLELGNFQILTGFNLLEKYYAQLPRDREKDIVLDLNQVELMGHFWKFALASYGWKGLNFLGRGNGVFSDGWRDNSDALSIVEYLSIPKADLLAYEFRSAEAFRPSYFIALDRSTDAIVLSIRGTMSVSDTLTDLVCTYEPWRGGIVHSGMKESAMWFLRNVAPQLLVYCRKYSVSRLYIIGHSLGSATAAILTMMLMDYLDEFKEQGGEGFTLECFGYAPACCLDLKLAEKYKENIHSFVSADDIVSKLSYGSMMTVKDMIIAGVEASKLVAPKSTEGDRWKLAFERISKVRDRCLASKENPRLYVAGQIYQFWLDPVPGNDTRVVIEKTSAQQVCSEVVIQRSVIGDHLPSNFDLAVKRCRETLMRQGQQQQKLDDTRELTISTDDLWHQFSTLKCDNKNESTN
ncbi:uncharacterized protein BX664DRAFT_339672 [Halteromyces radiatus]|uniref:uncharacterized protein n=1 Tax=Halteromyces radiatus TaxID=101107 RepID=UPI0022205CAE|nr:uncharacterized protein BX664DRAFT_339672 [Halteromyces radiatus]KAI8083036.1 hypothetical protein BX664DRAFT_339672 [Halteromyces radiatus]